MSRFVARPITVEAVRFEGTISFWPESFRLAVRRHQPGGITEIFTGDGVRPVLFGNHVVRGPDGLFTVWREAAFETWFASCEDVVSSPVQDSINKRQSKLLSDPELSSERPERRKAG